MAFLVCRLRISHMIYIYIYIYIYIFADNKLFEDKRVIRRRRVMRRNIIFPNMSCVKRLYKDKRRWCAGQQPGTKSDRCPANEYINFCAFCAPSSELELLWNFCNVFSPCNHCSLCALTPALDLSLRHLSATGRACTNLDCDRLLML